MGDPSYVALHRSGELARRAARAAGLLSPCTTCPRRCRTDRRANELGECGIGAAAVVASAGAHHGEEKILRGWAGSGTIFFAGCNLHCVFCQNDDISHWRPDERRRSAETVGAAESGRPPGRFQTDPPADELDAGALGALMIGLQKAGCHNLNLVTPSHVVPQILAALPLAVEAGLRLPLVYNTSGYDAVDTLALLDGVVDVYMPDFKVWDPDLAELALTARDYPAVARAAIAEMHRQVGDLTTDDQGLARRGLLVRHLVMPGATEDSREILRWLAALSASTAVNVMGQYRPAGRALRERNRWPQLSRATTRDEHRRALSLATATGLTRLLRD